VSDLLNPSDLYRFVVGEHGFYPNTSQWDYFYHLQSTNPVAGSLVWGQRGHDDKGGFQVHGEGKGIYSYHVPGWSPPADSQFDPLEQFVVGTVYTSSYKLLNETIPMYPTPWCPTILPTNTTENGTTYFPFIGGAWAEHYEIYHAAQGDSEWLQVENIVRDNVAAGLANYTIDKNVFGDGNGSWIMRGIGSPPMLSQGPWSAVMVIE
jgi:hypothetical protein